MYTLQVKGDVNCFGVLVKAAKKEHLNNFCRIIV